MQWRKESQTEKPLIRLDSVYKIYGEGENQVHALGGVSLKIEKGEYCAIMGASGSGKSTMMNIIGCLDRPTTGNYFFNGQNVASLSPRQLAELRNRSIGFVFQQFYLLPQLTALENVMLPMIYGGVPEKERRSRAIEALRKMGLGNRLDYKPNQLSGGQQQRVAIARAIVNQPLLLLADEPTGALDSETTKEILSIFQSLNEEGMTIVLVTHEADVAAQSSRIIHFADGRIKGETYCSPSRPST
ncbi:MAG: ABC transporter ATP-binding protein [Geminocystis sp.]|nr:ABC transporter ATP-binding protein [Geminocystis sp.]HIK36930.1 ABC transporter ATP-binding protein [Geminocystis sp. M7585_C2015_104]MCS7147835.1 ABC transporter ATP-binding protein [Geminocystis sp.]MCX8079538.1 ABC transporter ATP-binding protein [Geminocystis sp.]MDW8116798.1 ABC transporter ATP-binding protein [Geminocystis sp.]